MSLFIVFVVAVIGIPAAAFVLGGLLSGAVGRIKERKRHARLGLLPGLDGTAEPLRDMRAQAGAYAGMEALFGCRHRQHIQLMHAEDGCILRNVPWDVAWSKNCHACWFRTGRDEADAPPRLRTQDPAAFM